MNEEEEEKEEWQMSGGLVEGVELKVFSEEEEEEVHAWLFFFVFYERRSFNSRSVANHTHTHLRPYMESSA